MGKILGHENTYPVRFAKEFRWQNSCSGFRATTAHHGIWRLFKHIERNNIPMTSPVEMKLNSTEAKGTKMEEMAILYQSPEVGKTGADGKDVEVKDMPALSVLSYTWQGGRDNAAVTKARSLIDAELAKQNLKASGYRLFGYNSPFGPKFKFQQFKVPDTLKARLDLQGLLTKESETRETSLKPIRRGFRDGRRSRHGANRRAGPGP